MRGVPRGRAVVAVGPSWGTGRKAVFAAVLGLALGQCRNVGSDGFHVGLAHALGDAFHFGVGANAVPLLKVLECGQHIPWVLPSQAGHVGGAPGIGTVAGDAHFAKVLFAFFDQGSGLSGLRLDGLRGVKQGHAGDFINAQGFEHALHKGIAAAAVDVFAGLLNQVVRVLPSQYGDFFGIAMAFVAVTVGADSGDFAAQDEEFFSNSGLVRAACTLS